MPSTVISQIKHGDWHLYVETIGISFPGCVKTSKHLFGKQQSDFYLLYLLLERFRIDNDIQNEDELSVITKLSDNSVALNVAVGPNFDYVQPGLLLPEGGALWSVSATSVEKVAIGGGGERELTTEGQKMRFAEAKLNGPFCKVNEGLIWGIHRSTTKNVLYQVDLTSGEVEAILVGTKDAKSSQEGFFLTSPLSKDQKKAIVCDPDGPITSMMGPKGPIVYFHDNQELRLADLTTKTISKPADASGAFIHHPSIFIPCIETPHALYKASSPPADTIPPPTDNRRLTWKTKFSPPSTSLIDLDTGDTAVLFDCALHPLASLSPRAVLAIEMVDKPDEQNKKDCYVVFFDWTLPKDLESSPVIVKSEENRYLQSKDRIQRFIRLPQEYCEKSRFFFDPQSNTLFTSPDPGTSISRYANVFRITSKRSNGGSHTVYPLPMFRKSTFSPDLASLVLDQREGLYCLPSDSETTHSVSNTMWKLHNDILRHHTGLNSEVRVRKMASVIANSGLPSPSISAFLSFLYFSPPADLSKPIDAFMPICHCIQLCNQIGMGNYTTSYLLWLLEKKIIPKLPNEVLLQNILTLWFIEQDPSPESIATYSESSPLMSLLASRCRKYVTEAEIRNALANFDFQKASASVAQVCVLSSSLTSLLSSTSSTKLKKPELSSSAPWMPSQPLKWDDQISVQSRTPPSDDPYAFVFTIEGFETGGVVCSSLLLYPQWKWFEKLIKTTFCEEVKTRHVVLPSSFTTTSILAILSAPCGTYREGDAAKYLTQKDMAVIYRYTQQLLLHESPCFAKLASECHNILESSVDDNNCVLKLGEFWESGIGIHFELFAHTLRKVRDNYDAITLNVLTKIPMVLRTIICKFVDYKGDDFIAYASSLIQSIEALEPEEPPKNSPSTDQNSSDSSKI